MGKKSLFFLEKPTFALLFKQETPYTKGLIKRICSFLDLVSLEELELCSEQFGRPGIHSKIWIKNFKMQRSRAVHH